MNGTMVETRINDRWTLLLPSWRAARAEWATGWEVERLASMRDRLRPGMVLYDIGAEGGDMSALFASWVRQPDRKRLGTLPHEIGNIYWEPIKQTGGIVLVEPNPGAWPNIRAVWEANHLPEPIATWDGFASEVDAGWRGCDICRYGAWPESAARELRGDYDTYILGRDNAPTIKIDTLTDLTRRPPDAITIDVDGTEGLVLRGAKQTLREHRPLVWVSIHPDYMMARHGEYEQPLHLWMRDLGYRGTHLGYDHEHHWFYEPEAQR